MSAARGSSEQQPRGAHSSTCGRTELVRWENIWDSKRTPVYAVNMHAQTCAHLRWSGFPQHHGRVSQHDSCKDTVFTKHVSYEEWMQAW